MRRSYLVFGITISVAFGVGACESSCGVAPCGLVEPTGALLSPYAEAGGIVADREPNNGLPPIALSYQAFQVNEVLRQKIFTGKLVKKNLSFPERAVVSAIRAQEGDFRDWAQIKVWATGIADALLS